MAEMTMRERMLAVVEGRDHDRAPFVQYTGIVSSNEEAWAMVGRSNMGLLQWCSAHAVETPNCHTESVEFERDGARGVRSTLHTPAGTLTEEALIQPTYGARAIREHYVKEPDDYRVLLAHLRDMTVRENFDGVRAAIADLGDDGLPHLAVARTPYQQLWVQWVGIEDLCLHLVDCPERTDEVIAAMTDVQRRIFEIACAATRELPIPYVDVPDNITAPVIGETYFRRYCVPAYDELADMLAETGRDVPVFVHMDGDLKPLWDAIGESKVRGIDSLSPPPDNDTGIAEAAAIWPDMRLCPNFPSSVHLAEPEAIYRQAMKILDEGGRTGRLQIQISENVPPGLWKKSYPQIVRAIEDFGRPG